MAIFCSSADGLCSSDFFLDLASGLALIAPSSISMAPGLGGARGEKNDAAPQTRNPGF